MVMNFIFDGVTLETSHLFSIQGKNIHTNSLNKILTARRFSNPQVTG